MSSSWLSFQSAWPRSVHAIDRDVDRGDHVSWVPRVLSNMQQRPSLPSSASCCKRSFAQGRMAQVIPGFSPDLCASWFVLLDVMLESYCHILSGYIVICLGCAVASRSRDDIIVPGASRPLFTWGMDTFLPELNDFIQSGCIGLKIAWSYVIIDKSWHYGIPLDLDIFAWIEISFQGICREFHSIEPC